MTLIRELIAIPEQVQDGDFVLKLTQGVSGEQAARTVDSYVVTPQLAQAFDEALGLVASALGDSSSKAVFLQGSFGSGKSHFMAILHLLLRHDPHARSIPQLHAALDKWGPRIDGRRFLLVPIHFLDARSMEQKILGGYVEAVQALHPDAPVPPVFLGDEIVAQELPGLRSRLGEDAFLAALNDAADSSDDWGDFGQTWTTSAVDRALAAPATSRQRQELVAAYVAAFRPATTLEAVTTGTGFIDLDHGLAAISAHAQQLGYDAVVLFLDELILWLASNIGNLDFVQRESQKLTKLVEATAAARPVPIVSFIARQRDLRDLVGDHIAGVEVRTFSDNLAYQSGRFGEIVLSSGNLPVVAKQRLLKPVDDHAAQQLHAAVDAALAGRDEVRRILLGSDADAELFRTVYPFSPALVHALVDVSEALQRERTALKVMLQLLVDRRNDLSLGQLIPVGDLWDVVAGRDEPFSKDLKAMFETAKRLYRTKLRPHLLAAHRITDDTPPDAPARTALATDERLVKTVLLASLVPEVEAFRNLDAARLAALNWGSITSPIPGQETQIVASKLRRLSGNVGELQVGDDPANPTVSIRLVDVDTEELIDRAIQDHDNLGARRRAVRELIGALLDGRIGADLQGPYEHEWRGTVRAVDIRFANIRDTVGLPDSALQASGDRPRLLVDFPFDEPSRCPEDDLERLDAWLDSHPPTTTVCWLPSFFNAEGLKALGRYVAVSEMLKGDRFEQYTSHLSQTQGLQARPVVENTSSQLAIQLKEAILAAYGVTSGSHPFVDPVTALTDHYRTLDPGLVVRPTTKPSLAGALGEVCDQVFAYLYPRHPHFDSRVKPADLRATWAEVKRALAEPDGRVIVEPGHRGALRNVATGLELGLVAESHFQLGERWRTALDRRLASARAAGQVVTVDQVRSWINDETPDQPRGLPDEIADLIVLTVAAQTDHRLVADGLTLAGEAGKPLPAHAQLRQVPLPTVEAWDVARTRAALVLGVTVGSRLSGPELASLATQARAKAGEWAASADRLVARLEAAYREWRLAGGDRLATARAARDLVVGLKGEHDDGAVVDRLVAAAVPTSEQALARSLSTAEEVDAALADTNFPLLDKVRTALEAEVTRALQADELVVAYPQAKKDLERRATSLVGTGSPAPAPAAARSTPAERTLTVRRGGLDAAIGQLRAALEQYDEITITWQPRSGS
jgi:hypothetical protein